MKGIQTRAARRGAARVPSGQSGSNGRLWDEAPPLLLPPPPPPLLWRQTFHLCKVIEVICRKGSERGSRVAIKSHMKGESGSIVCPVSVHTAGYLLRQFGLSTSDTQRRPSWDSNLLVTSLLL